MHDCSSRRDVTLPTACLCGCCSLISHRLSRICFYHQTRSNNQIIRITRWRTVWYIVHSTKYNIQHSRYAALVYVLMYVICIYVYNMYIYVCMSGLLVANNLSGQGASNQHQHSTSTSTSIKDEIAKRTELNRWSESPARKHSIIITVIGGEQDRQNRRPRQTLVGVSQLVVIINNKQ